MGFDFTFHMAQLCADMALRLPELNHLDIQRIAVRYCQTRKGVAHGLQATLTPLRFEGGSHSMLRGGRRWTIQRLFDAQGREMLYLLSFYLPRFLNHSPREKLTTVMHELWHIDPSFNGDLRRLPGRCYAHGNSERHYDQAMRELVDQWLSLGPPAERYAFLEYDFGQLSSLYGAVYGARIATPKLIPAESNAA
jgi:predicted metallopeptidase